MPVVLFLCSGNYYRSRFAEHLFNSLAEEHGLEWRAESRGLACDRPTGNVGPISRWALQGLERRGICIPGQPRCPILVTETDLENAGLIVAVKEAEHRRLLDERFPDWTDRVEYWQIHDVDCAEPDQALAEMERQVRTLIADLSRRWASAKQPA